MAGRAQLSQSAKRSAKSSDSRFWRNALGQREKTLIKDKRLQLPLGPLLFRQLKTDSKKSADFRSSAHAIN